MQTTFMLFIAGDNDLDLFGEGDLNEILSVKDTGDELNILVQYDYSFDFGNPSTKRYVIEDGSIIHEHDMGETNTGSVETLQSFLRWGIDTYPADRTIVVLWNHGGGTLDKRIDQYYSNFEDEAILFDDDSKDYLDNLELQRVFEAFDNKIDIIGFDACLMGMVEVVYQLKDHAKVVVGSEELEPGTGWDYGAILRYIVAHPEATNEAISQEIVRSFIHFYHKKNLSVTLSSISTDRLDNVVGLMDEFAKSLLDSRKLSIATTLLPFYNATQKFSKSYLDLYHFVSLIKAYYIKEEFFEYNIVRSAERLLDALDLLIIKNGTHNLENAYGLSVYLPLSESVSDFSLEIFSQLDINHHTVAPYWFGLFKEIANIKSDIDNINKETLMAKIDTLDNRKIKQWDMAQKRYVSAEQGRKNTKSIESVEERERKKLRESLFDNNDYFALERVLGESDLLPINYLSRGLEASRSVCRINIRTQRGIPEGYGTGFLISPSLLLTNNHVLPSREYAQKSQAEFNFEMDEVYQLRESHFFRLDSDKFFYSSEELDFTLVAVNPLSISGSSLSEFGYLQLIEASGKSLVTESISIIQHPEGSDKHISIRNNKILGRFKTYIHYEADTMPGSSGSPVFNDQWDVVALHHSGIPKKNSTGKPLKKDGRVWRKGDSVDSIDWIANEGIRISSIFGHLKAQPSWTIGEARVLEELGTFSNSDLNESIIRFGGANNILTGDAGTKQPNFPAISQIKLSTLVDRLEEASTTEQELAPYFVRSDKSIRGIDPLFKINQELVFSDVPALQESALLLNSANWICKRTRQKEYRKKLEQGAKIKIISEGDSWFQYPFILNDVIDHLMDVEDFAILSFGEAGDLIRDIVAKSEFTSALSSEKPDFFLISGGGNDFVAGGGIKNYVNKPDSSFNPKQLIDRIEFSKFKARLASDYTNLFSIILHTSPDTKIICHGYSYPIPNNGPWLGEPLNELGIVDQQLQIELVRMLFDEINTTLKQTAASFPQSVHYLDIRNVVPARGWFDELHPTNPFYGDIASLFQAKIEELL